MKLTGEIMYQASLEENPVFEGFFLKAEKTTGIFCRANCTAKKLKPENIEFFKNTQKALENGYRPCKICKPLENIDTTPSEILDLIKEILDFPKVKLKDSDLIARQLDPANIKRWFLKNHGISFQEFQKQIFLNEASNKIIDGNSILDTAYNSGFKNLSGFNESFKKIFGKPSSKIISQKLFNVKRLETPVGTMYAAATNDGVCMLEFGDRINLENTFQLLAKSLDAVMILGENPFLSLLEKELNLYFNEKLQKFTVTLAPVGTDFQKSVWEILQKIPYGEIWSYKKQAEILGDVKKVRAVANANGLNKISIVIPCHRVIGSNGKLTGYGGGVWRKQKLLQLEKSKL